MRLRRDEELAGAVDAWLEAEPRRPEDVPPADWLRWEQDKHTSCWPSPEPPTGDNARLTEE